ncbi:hypothetical protein J5J86_05980 [Aquabacter sp. L1I39]|uniref:sensor histidine kinase n=1 Tax=Aquabacter sp. L1I39 TaxID=2820278 RepID=UPI001ADC8D91|nr:ATP-binding protein [Aquabacter sp. L1I39]QTL04864.1 hypothetical protein J5J86_05980 [Aquabacter sp. L1I39]
MSSLKRRSLRAFIVPAALTGAIVVLFAATIMLFDAQSAQRTLLNSSIRSTGWATYQAQLELLKTKAALAEVRVEPSQARIQNLVLRLELLISRVNILHTSSEMLALESISTRQAALMATEHRLALWSDRLAHQDPGEAVETLLQGLNKDLQPLEVGLQTVLQESVAFNDKVFQREKELARNPARVPFALLIIATISLVVILVVQSVRDTRRVAELAQLERSARAMQDNLRAIIEAMPAATIIIDADTRRVLFINPHAAHLVAATPQDEEWVRLVQLAFDVADSPGQPQWGLINLTFPRARGDVISLRGALSPVLWEGRRQLLLVLADTTRIRSSQLQIMQTAKLATLGEMATAIAHELNQPLAVIKMAVANAVRIVKGGGEAEAVLGKLDRIGAQVDRAKRITDQVRRYGRMPSDQKEPFSARHAIELAASFVAEQYRAANIRLVLELELPPDLAVRGDQTMFEQVIVNLLVNARDAFGGEASVPAGATVRVRAHPGDGQVHIRVCDNAGGIAAHILDHIFEPFMTTKPADKGTGLGLAVSRNVLRDMHGQISATNADGGACFDITLPVSVEDMVPAA